MPAKKGSKTAAKNTVQIMKEKAAARAKRAKKARIGILLMITSISWPRTGAPVTS